MFKIKNIKALYKLRIKQIRNFLFSNEFREFLFFCFFVFIASIFWLLNALNYDHEDEMNIKVNITNVPKNIIIVSEEPQYIKLKIKDKGIKLINYIIRFKEHNINIDFNDINNNVGYTFIKSRNLIAENSILSPETSVISCIPDTLKISYASAVAVKLPVVLKSNVKADPFHYIKDTIITPDSVMAFIPTKIKDNIRNVVTKQISHTELSDSITFDVDIEKDANIKLMTQKVRVHYDVGIYVDKTLSIPIRGINLPNGIELRTFPTSVNISFQVGIDNFNAITEADFIAAIDYAQIKNNSLDKASVKLIKVPHMVRNIRIEQPNVEFLIEKTVKE